VVNGVLESEVELMATVEKDIENIYSRINHIDSRVNKLEASQPFLTNMIEKNTLSNEKMTEAMEAVTKAMVHMEDRITEQGNKIDSQGVAIDSIKKDFERANERIKFIQDEGKFNVIDWLKRNFPWLIIIVGLCGFYALEHVPV
jgi:chromosome segregation ATPase